MTTMQTIIDYVFYTPCNPNKQVLKSLLNSFLEDNGGSIGGLPDKIFQLPSDRGELEVSPAEPQPGDKVTITPNPKPGYVVTGITAIDTTGNPVEITDNGDGSYSYIQPDKTSVIPMVEYDPEGQTPPDEITYDGGAPDSWTN